MTTDDDILAALNGRPNAKETALNESITEALNGAPTPRERVHNTAVLEALGHDCQRTPSTGEMPLQSRGDDLEAVSIWATKEAATVAIKALAESIMRADGDKGIYAAETEARAIAEEQYAAAAKTTPYEDRRQEAVAAALESIRSATGTAGGQTTFITSNGQTTVTKNGQTTVTRNGQANE